MQFIKWINGISEVSADIEEIKKNKKFAKVERKTYKELRVHYDPVERRRIRNEICSSRCSIPI